MKPPRMPVMKMPLPSTKELAAGQRVISAFAHHAPAKPKTVARMERPGKPGGPRN